jgi:predicted alpha/beta-fold hydrolase
VHGLGDDRDHPYIKRFAARAHTLGWRVVAFSYWRFDFSDGRDLTAAVDHIHAQDPASPLVAVAWSAGGHLLTRYLQEAGASTPLVAAVTSSGCFDLPRVVLPVAVVFEH